jgi:hypothetical protein
VSGHDRSEAEEDERYERLDLLMTKFEWFCAGMVFGSFVIALIAVLS